MKSPTYEVFKLIAHPFRDYVSGILRKPDDIGSIGLVELLRFALGSCVITAILDRILHSEYPFSHWTDTPYVDEILAALVILCLGVLNVFVHFPLRWAGGEGTLSETLSVGLHVSIAFLPIITICQAIPWWKEWKSAQLVMGLTELNIAAPILAAVHGISVRRTALVLFLTVLVLIFLGVGAMELLTMSG